MVQQLSFFARTQLRIEVLNMASNSEPRSEQQDSSLTSENETPSGCCGQLAHGSRGTDPVWQSPEGRKPIHPNAPRGGGGPGNFGSQQSLTSHSVNAGDQLRDHPASPIPLGHGKKPATTGAKAKPAPVVTADQQATNIIKEDGEFVKIDLNYQIKKDEVDGSINSPASTTLNDNWPDPVFTAPSKDKPGSMVWNGTIEIRTRYKWEQIEDPEDPAKKVATASGYSCYGRWTTVADRNDGNITLGFHESCHRADYATSLKSLTGCPPSPILTKDTTKQEFEEMKSEFLKAVNEWREGIINASNNDTDEQGHTKSQGGCFQHNPRKD
jgi:hypothetical protein